MKPSFMWLAVAVWARMTIPAAINYIEQPHMPQTVGTALSRTPFSTVASIILTLILFIVCLILLFTKQRDWPRLPVAWLIVAITPVWLLSLQYLLEWGLEVQELVILASSALVIVVTWHLSPALHEVASVGYLASFSVFASLLLLLWKPTHAVFVDQYGNTGNSVKSLIGSDQVAGIFGHSNTLGIVSVVAIAVLLYQKSSWKRNLHLVACLFGVLLSASRTAMVALFVMIAVSLVARAIKYKGKRLDWIAALLLAAVVIVPLVSVQQSAFTGRGRIWASSLLASGESWLIGLGPNWFSDIGVTTQELGSEAGSGHNLFVQVFVTGGLVGLIAYSLVFAAYLKKLSQFPADQSRALLRRFLAVVATIGILEFAWSLDLGGDLFLTSWFLLIALLCSTLPHETLPNGAAPAGRSPA